MADAAADSTSADATTDATAPSERLRTVAILADDLIWSTRLSDAVRAAGARPRVVRRLEDLERTPASDVIVDLTARAYDGVAAVRVASGSGARVVAVGQHDDAALRRAAIEAGASKVFTYRALFENGSRLLSRWLAP